MGGTTEGSESSLLGFSDLIETVIVLVYVGSRALWDSGVSYFVAVFSVVNLDLVVVRTMVESQRWVPGDFGQTLINQILLKVCGNHVLDIAGVVSGELELVARVSLHIPGEAVPAC